MKRFASIFAVFLLLSAPFSPVRAETFDPAFVLSDGDLTDSAVPAGFSQQFLVSRGAGIAKMKFQDIDGSLKSPGDIIDFYGAVYGINPRFLLALIQKEQSLVGDPDPSVCQIDWATGYGRPDGSTCDGAEWQKHRGFTSQIANAAEFVRYFYDLRAAGKRPTFGFFPGVQAVIDGTQVTPSNLATAILYTYTPHLHGNRNLRKIWSDWFGGGHPDGSYLSGSDGSVWLIQGGLKRRFASKSILASRVDTTRVIRVDDGVLAGYEEGAPIRFSEYALVREPGGTVYLLVGDKKRAVESMQVFRTIGFNPEEIEDASAEELAAYGDGEPITLGSSYPTGALLQDNKTGGVYFVESGKKFPIYSAEIMKVNFPGRKIQPVAKSVLDQYPDSEPVRFREGELVMGKSYGPTVFVISNGQRRAIPTEAVFNALGYSWNRIIRTNDAAIQLHPEGAPLAMPASGRVQAATAS